MAMLALPTGLRHRQVVILEEIARRLVQPGPVPRHRLEQPKDRCDLVEMAASIVLELERADIAADAACDRIVA